MKHSSCVFPPVPRRTHTMSSWVLVMAIGAGVAVRAAEPPLRITASSETLGIAAGVGRDVRITITQWSSESARARVVETFLQRGPWRLLDVLQKEPVVGQIRVPRLQHYHLRFAARYPLPDGERLILMTDRTLSPWITWTQLPPLSDYPFALIEVRLDRTGQGVGKLSLATRVTYDDEERIVALERYSGAPVWIQNVRVETRD